MAEVITWTSADHGAIARIRMPMPSKGGSKIGWSPVVIHAATEDEAREKAHAFYQSELGRLDELFNAVAATFYGPGLPALHMLRGLQCQLPDYDYPRRRNPAVPDA